MDGRRKFAYPNVVMRWTLGCLLALVLPSAMAMAGPPFVSDDPEPTDYRHYEVYLFTNGTKTRDDLSGATGIDFNYGARPDLQLTAVLPLAYDRPASGGTTVGLGNIELAAKYRFLHQEQIGWDIAVFPRVFLPTVTSRVGQNHPSLLLPLWLERDWAGWSTFGGGGCEINRGQGAKDFCLAGWALVRQVAPDLRIGAEIVHQTPDARGGRPFTGVGFGLQYDVGDNYHLLAYAGPGLQNAAETGLYTWYASILFTF
jgi:hypothetical protein